MILHLCHTFQEAQFTALSLVWHLTSLSKTILNQVLQGTIT